MWATNVHISGLSQMWNSNGVRLQPGYIWATQGDLHFMEPDASVGFNH